jgi:hypothetical protein
MRRVESPAPRPPSWPLSSFVSSFKGKQTAIDRAVSRRQSTEQGCANPAGMAVHSQVRQHLEEAAKARANAEGVAVRWPLLARGCDSQVAVRAEGPSVRPGQGNALEKLYP